MSLFLSVFLIADNRIQYTISNTNFLPYVKPLILVESNSTRYYAVSENKISAFGSITGQITIDPVNFQNKLTIFLISPNDASFIRVSNVVNEINDLQNTSLKNMDNILTLGFDGNTCVITNNTPLMYSNTLILAYETERSITEKLNLGSLKLMPFDSIIIKVDIKAQLLFLIANDRVVSNVVVV